MLSPRRLQGLFLTVTLLFATAVGWLGWKLLEQDRALARQRRVEQLEAAADRVAGALYRRLEEFEELAGAGQLPEGAVRLRARTGSLEVWPADGLLYYPVVPEARTAPAGVFAASEDLEFRRNDPDGAAAALRQLAGSPDTGVRAAALVRMGRNLRKAGRVAEALHAYDQMAGMGAATVDGLPADLAALESRCALLEQMGRRAELRREAEVLARKLMSGQARLRHATWESQLDQATRWLGGDAKTRQDEGKAALSAAAEALWAGWEREQFGKGRQIIAAGRPVVAVWTSNRQELAALLAPAAALESTLGEAGPFTATLADGEGRPLVGRSPEAAKLRVERSPASTKLPWTLAVASDDDAAGELAGRRRLLGGGFALLVALLAGVSFIVARAVAKEMAVARLQADFVAAVSHEFRSPLSSISQISELLNEDRWPSPERKRKGYEILSRESARLKRLVEGLLDFTRMEAGTAGYRLEPVQPEDLVRAVVEEFRPGANGATLDLKVSADLPGIRADGEALRRALWNLMENAVKYSPGTARVHVEAARDGAWLAIRVRDEGMGIPAEEQSRIFQKFYRGSEAKELKVKGTGIGLAMVRHIVEGHGGEIRVDSAPGRGSTFTILLPEEKET